MPRICLRQLCIVPPAPHIPSLALRSLGHPQPEPASLQEPGMQQMGQTRLHQTPNVRAWRNSPKVHGTQLLSLFETLLAGCITANLMWLILNEAALP